MDIAVQVQVLQLESQGRFAEAAHLLKRLSDTGDATAKVMLALVGEQIGMGREACVNLVAEVEAAGPYRDFATNFQLFKAYDAYLGSGAPEQMPKVAQSYHESAAMADDAPVHVIEAVAHRYQFGSSSNEVDLVAAKKWYELAQKKGSARAATLAKTLRALD